MVGREKGITSLLPWWVYWKIWECHTIEALNFILKTYKNSGIIVEQRTWDIVLDLIILSFNFSRLKWRLRSPWLKVIWVSLKSDRFILVQRRILVERMFTFEEWKYCSNSWSIAKFGIAQGRAKVRLGGVCWRYLSSIINHQ